MNWILNRMFEREIQRKTAIYLDRVARAATDASRRNASNALAGLRDMPGPSVTLGETMWGEPVIVPVELLMKTWGLITGAMGTGKSLLAAIILEALLSIALRTGTIGVGLIDPKRDLYLITLYLLDAQLRELEREDPEAARRARKRIRIWDFSDRHLISAYNFLARPANVEPDFFASNRVAQIVDQLPENLKLVAASLLHNLILLLSEFGLPAVPYFSLVLHDERLRGQLLARSRNPSLVAYFARQLAIIPNSTIAALERRIDALFVSESVRLAFSGTTAPDFRRHQDDGDVLVMNFFGENIGLGTQQRVLDFINSDFTHSLFARRKKDRPFLLIVDEAQTLFLTEKMRENMTHLLTKSRHFGSSFLLITQNMSAAIRDARMYEVLHTNLGWSLSLRDLPADAAFLKPMLPVTGTRVRPKQSPFEETSCYTATEERSILLEEIANLPDRTGYLWLKGRTQEAIRIRTRDLDIPHGVELEKAISAIERDPTIGGRLSRKEYEHRIAERDRKWMAAENEGELGTKLRLAYRKGGGGRDEEARRP